MTCCRCALTDVNETESGSGSFLVGSVWTCKEKLQAIIVHKIYDVDHY